jgi:hypothetical protein
VTRQRVPPVSASGACPPRLRRRVGDPRRWPIQVEGAFGAIVGWAWLPAPLVTLIVVLLELMAIPPLSRLLARRGPVLLVGFTSTELVAVYTFIAGFRRTETVVRWRRPLSQVTIERGGPLFGRVRLGDVALRVPRRQRDDLISYLAQR